MQNIEDHELSVNFAGEYEELELAELDEINGGTTWVCLTVGVSVALCPTTKCTSQCGR